MDDNATKSGAASLIVCDPRSRSGGPNTVRSFPSHESFGRDDLDAARPDHASARAELKTVVMVLRTTPRNLAGALLAEGRRQAARS